MRCISIGIDIGSTIIKVVAWDENLAWCIPTMCVITKRYRSHL